MLYNLKEYDADYPYVSNFAMLAFCLYVIIWYLQIGYRIAFFDKIRFEFFYTAFLGLFAILSAGKIEYYQPVAVAIVLLFVSMIIQIPFSYDLQTSWEIFFDRVVKFSFMAFFIIRFVKSPKHLVFFLAAFLLACMKMGQEGFIGQITGGTVWQNQGVMRLHGSTPNFIHPNSFSGMALGTIPFIIYLYPISSRIIKYLLIVQFVFALNIVIHTGSRTGYVGFCILMLYVFLRQKKNKAKIFIIFCIIAGISFPFMQNQYMERFETIFTQEDIEGHSIDKRKVILEDATKIFFDHPLGVGVAAFPAVRMKTFGRMQDTHNLYLQVATNLGIQGLIIFMYFLSKVMKGLCEIRNNINDQIRKISDANKSTGDRLEKMKIEKHLLDLKLLHATARAVILFIIVRLVLGLFGMDLYEIYWWFAAGLAISLHNINKYSALKTEKILSSTSLKNEKNIELSKGTFVGFNVRSY